MRKYLRLSLGLTLVAGLGTVAVLVFLTMSYRPEIELLQRGLEILPGVSQHLQNFRRVKMKDGRKVWEVAAADARYFDAENTVVVRGPILSWYMEDGRRIGLEGTEGRILIEKGEVARVELVGDIQVFLADYRVAADSAVYDRATDRIIAPGVVEITGEALHLRGEGLEIQVKDQRLLLQQNVSMVMQPALLRERHSKS